jgi:DNA-binding beta-propeller fold protein YncE
MKTYWQLIPALALALAAFPVSRADAQQETTQEIVWPLPPDQPVIRFDGVLYSEQDLGKDVGFFAKISGALVGTRERMLAVQRPHDVWTDDGGRMFVTNGLQSGFWIFDPNEKEARIVNPAGAATVGKPMGITGDGAGTIFIADPSGKRVVAMDEDGQFVQAYGGRDALLNPVDVALSPSGHRVYVADAYCHQVLIFDRTSGQLLRKLGRDEGDVSTKEAAKLATTHGLPDHGQDADTPPEALDAPETPGHGDDAPIEPSDLWENRGAAEGEFRYPAFLTTGPDGRLYVSDGMNFRVQVFDEDGEYLSMFGRMGDTPGAFSRPKGIEIDSEGHVYVVDGAFNNVQIFDTEGQLLMVFGEFGNGAGQLWLPTGIFIDEQDRIFVADRYNSRIQIFQYLGSPELMETGDAEPEPVP